MSIDRKGGTDGVEKWNWDATESDHLILSSEWPNPHFILYVGRLMWIKSHNLPIIHLPEGQYH